MDFKEAQDIITGLVFGAQKARSNIAELDLGDDMSAYVSPWLFGPKSVLPKLLEWQADTNRSGVVKGSDLYNFVYIATRLEMGISLAAYANGYVSPVEPDVLWMTEVYERVPS